jgi:hypothetical protein
MDAPHPGGRDPRRAFESTIRHARRGGAVMLLVREVMYCKPGKVRAMVEKTLAMAKMMEKSGQGRMRVLTDVASERYWMLVMEFETKSMQQFDDMMAGRGQSEQDMKEMEGIMKGYHDLVDYGRREIYKIEG